jgi:predicted glycosyltransferase involved in capsule biosynthesis
MRLSKLSVVIPWKSDHAEREDIFIWIYNRYLSFPNVKTLITAGNEDFTRSYARNQGVKQVNTDYVLLADADTIPRIEDIEQAYTLLNNGAPWVLCYADNEYYNLTQEKTLELLQFDPSVEVQRPSPDEYEHRLTSWAGMIMLRKSDFDKVGGYDERFVGWGWEDNAFQLKMDNEIGKHVRTDGFALHMWHPRGSDEFNTPSELVNRRIFEEYRRKYSWNDPR